jgi:hypothetical protein
MVPCATLFSRCRKTPRKTRLSLIGGSFFCFGIDVMTKQNRASLTTTFEEIVFLSAFLTDLLSANTHDELRELKLMIARLDRLTTG